MSIGDGRGRDRKPSTEDSGSKRQRWKGRGGGGGGEGSDWMLYLVMDDPTRQRALTVVFQAVDIRFLFEALTEKHRQSQIDPNGVSPALISERAFCTHSRFI